MRSDTFLRFDKKNDATITYATVQYRYQDSKILARFVYSAKVSFFGQCSKMQKSHSKNVTLKLVLSNFFGFSDENVDQKVR